MSFQKTQSDPTSAAIGELITENVDNEKISNSETYSTSPLSEAGRSFDKTQSDATAAEIEKLISENMNDEKLSKLKTYSFTPSEEPSKAKSRSFDPARIFYSTDTASYFVDVESHFRPYGRKNPIKVGVRRYLERQGTSPNDIKELLEVNLEDIEIDRAVDWVGALAGHRRGLIERNGRSFLITDEPKIPESAEGRFPLHQAIIDQAFPNADARAVFEGWLSGGVAAIRHQTHQPAPMLVMAGPAKAGKSLLAHIVAKCFGGRSANPMTAWSGQLPWNDNLLAAELLLIDDSVTSTDPRARKAFGSRFKESIYAGDVEINTRRKSSLSLRPVWRVMVCCNETPENLSVIPPLEEGIEDKIILLKVSPVKTPMPARAVEEKEAFAAALTAELPAFLYHLESFVVPYHLSDSRSGVTAWKDPDLLRAVSEISPEKHMENLIALAIAKGHFPEIDQNGDWMSAADVQSVLQDRCSPTASQAYILLKHAPNCGRYLATLSRQGSLYVSSENPKQIKGTVHYLITRPFEDTVKKGVKG